MAQLSHGGDLSAESFSILVVEDDLPTAQLLRHLLAKCGYGVRLVDSLAAARAELQSTPPDLVLLDRMLPDGDGLTLARELKSGTSSLSHYVLMLTAAASGEAKVEGFDNGADDYVTKPFEPDELLARVRAGLRIVDLQRALIAGNRRLELISTTDVVTGARNRRWFDEELDRAFAHAMRYERPLSLAIIDVDHFKQVNDSFGHLAGDTVLREIAERIGASLRKSDSLARVGGEEFAVILPETALFEGLQAAEKIRSSVSSDNLETGAEAIEVTISAGVASIPHSRFVRASQLLTFADLALYRAKNRGRNRVELERRAEPWRPTRPGLGRHDPRTPGRRIAQ